MRIILIGLLIVVCGLAQTSSDFHFSNSETDQQMGEIATAVRSITDIPICSVDRAQKILSLHGTPSQIVAADWVFNKLEKPQAGQSPTDEYLMPGNDPEKAIRVFYLAHTDTVQSFQEVATVIRSALDIRRLFTYSTPRALIVRGTPDQSAAAEWLVNNLDTPANVSRSVKRQYAMPAGADRVVRVFYLSHTDTVQNFQEAATLIRTIGDIRRMFTYNGPRAVIMRGTAEQAALAEWLVQQLDQPADAVNPGKREYVVPGPGDPDNVVRVFSLAHAGTPQRLQEVAVQVRTTTSVRRLFTYNAPRVIALRGTPGQVEQAAQLIGELDR